MKLAVNAAKPPTKAPTRPVAIIMSQCEGVLKSISAILVDSRCLFFTSMYEAINVHKKNKAKKPARKEKSGFCGINAATRNAAIAIIHQSKYNPPAKLNNAVIRNAVKNFMCLCFVLNYCHIGCP
jgi:hypothetical protein